jgi:predicted alpha/beta superfamily hydrolase
MKNIFLSRLLPVLSMLLLASPGTFAQTAPTRPSTAGASVQVLGPLAMPGLDRQRRIRVYLPPSYGSGHRRYRVLYMHDGQNLFDDATSFVGEWGVDESMDALAKSDGIELIVVGIDHGDDKRIAELSPWTNPRYAKSEGAQYMDFVVGTVKPYIDQHFRTRTGRDDTGIMGSSLGALSSHYAVHQYPQVFGKAGMLSPSYWYSAEIYDYTAAHDLPPGTRLYLAIGGKEGDTPMAEVGHFWRMVSLLQSKQQPGVSIHAAVVAGAGHNEGFWRREFPQAVRYLFKTP